MTQKLFIIAGEASGDYLAAKLVAAIRADNPDIHISGIGGPELESQGVKSLFPIDDIAIMGIFEIIPRLGKIKARIDQTCQAILADRPDIVITIDSPGFAKRVIKNLIPHKQNMRFVHYVAPSVWAWRAGRAKIFAGLYDQLLTLLPFEPPWFERYKLDSHFVGHAVLENQLPTQAEITSWAKAAGLDPERPSLLILPGSRQGEIKRLLPIFLDSWQLFYKQQLDAKGAKQAKNWQAIIATIEGQAGLVRQLIDDYYNQPDTNLDAPKPIIEASGRAGRLTAMCASTLALAASGSVSLELALCQTPHVIGYKINPLTWAIVKRLGKTKFVNLVNILLKRQLIPECLQNQCEASILTSYLSSITKAETARKAQIKGMKAALELLAPLGADTPSQTAARVLLAPTLSNGDKP